MIFQDLINSGITCQDDLIEFREAMKNLKKEKGRNDLPSETEMSKNDN